MNLLELRKHKGFTQQKLAKKLNVDQTTISKWEQKVTKPRFDMIEKIASIFKISEAEVIEILK